VDSRVLEAVEECVHVVRRKHVQVGGIVLGVSSRQKAQTILEPVRVWYRCHERPVRPEDAAQVVDDSVRIA